MITMADDSEKEEQTVIEAPCARSCNTYERTLAARILNNGPLMVLDRCMIWCYLHDMVRFAAICCSLDQIGSMQFEGRDELEHGCRITVKNGLPHSVREGEGQGFDAGHVLE